MSAEEFVSKGKVNVRTDGDRAHAVKIARDFANMRILV
jgi:hypothetical protein